LTKIIGSAALAPSGDSGTDLTNKGDLHGYSSSNTRVPIGDDDQVLTADSAQALGLKWATASSGGIMTKLYDTTLGSDGSANSTQFEADFSTDPLTLTDYSYFDCWISGTTESDVSMDLNFIIDQISSNKYYNTYTETNNSGVQTFGSFASSTTGTIGNTTILPGNSFFYCHGVFGFNPADTDDLSGFFDLFQYSNGYRQTTRINGFNILPTPSQVSYIGIGAVGDSYLLAGTRFNINGYKMA